MEDLVHEAQRKVILDLAEKEPCVIIGRNADYILKDRDDVLNVLDPPQIFLLYHVRQKHMQTIPFSEIILHFPECILAIIRTFLQFH